MSESIEERLWGTYQVLYSDDFCKVKKLVVWPGHSLCLQKHSQRSEHWYVISGQGLFYNNGKMKFGEKGDSFDLPVDTLHKATALDGTESLVFIEVQTGTYFGEDDITRYETYEEIEGIEKLKIAKPSRP